MTPLTITDYQRAANQLEVPVAAVIAIAKVESAGSGFLADGRPKILFEKHVFIKRLRAHGFSQPQIDALGQAHPDIVGSKAGGYLGGAAEYPRLDRAKCIHSAAAIESCSWGMFQIMGYHWQRLGYASAEQFANHLSRDAAHHLDAFVRFIRAEPALHRALRWKKWADVARLYNGPAYAINSYDTKLAAAYAHAVQQHPEPARAV